LLLLLFLLGSCSSRRPYLLGQACQQPCTGRSFQLNIPVKEGAEGGEPIHRYQQSSVNEVNARMVPAAILLVVRYQQLPGVQ
jgi:hypothetical protein